MLWSYQAIIKMSFAAPEICYPSQLTIVNGNVQERCIASSIARAQFKKKLYKKGGDKGIHINGHKTNENESQIKSAYINWLYKYWDKQGIHKNVTFSLKCKLKKKYI